MEITDENAIISSLNKGTEKSEKCKSARPAEGAPKKSMKPEVSGGQGAVLTGFAHGKTSTSASSMFFPEKGAR